MALVHTNCTFCKAIGKPESEYTTHFVKDQPGPNGRIVCPLLLNSRCRYCKQTGHTLKYCEKLAEANQRRARQVEYQNDRRTDGNQDICRAAPHRTKTARVQTPFCSVCRHAGRPESEYTTHFVKDRPGPDGRVICPLLLSQRCRYCKVFGHTPKQCPKLLKRKAKAAVWSPPLANDEMKWDWLDSGITPEEEEDARITNRAVEAKSIHTHNRLAQMKGTGLGPLNPEDVNMYHDWCATRWGDWERTGMGATFFDQTTRRKYGWEEWCVRWWLSQKARNLQQKKKDSNNPMCEEQIHQCLFAQTLYSKIEEENAMADADREFEYLSDLDKMPEFADLRSIGDKDEYPSLHTSLTMSRPKLVRR